MAQRGFEALVDEARQADVTGWDFSWLEGRATEARPSWGYQRKLKLRLADADSALDLDTGGGEMLAGAAPFPPTMAATESWEPNLARAATVLHKLGAVVVRSDLKKPLPFAAGSFELITSRHPVAPPWHEIHRLPAPSGTYFAQHVGPQSVFELSEFFRGRLPEAAYRSRSPDVESAAATAAGLDVVSIRSVRTRIEIFDVGAAVYLLRKCPWWVPDFTVEKYAEHLRRLHRLIEHEGTFIAHSARTLIEARKPVR